MIPLRTALVVCRTYRRCYTTDVSGVTKYKVLFCGSDHFSIESLRAVLNARDIWSHVHVLCPDVKLVGRGGKRSQKVEQKSPLMLFAEENGLDVTTVSQVISDQSTGPVLDGEKNPSSKGRFDDVWIPPRPFDSPDPSHLLLTASFGHIIPNSFLEKFQPVNRLNVHPSLLPKYRGAAPLQWTILNGDRTTGITVQRLVSGGKGVDSGDIVGVKEDIRVPLDATFTSLIQELAPLGGELLVKVLREMQDGTNIARPQDKSKITRAPKVDKDSTSIDWNRHDALAIDRMHRGLSYKSPVHTPSGSMYLMDPVLFEGELPSSVQKAVDDFDAVEFGTAFVHKEPKDSWTMFLACKPSSADQQYSWLTVRSIKKGVKQKSAKDWWNGLRDLEHQKCVKLE